MQHLGSSAGERDSYSRPMGWARVKRHKIKEHNTDLQLKDHVEHAIRAVGLQQLHDVGVFQHVADAGLPLQIYKMTISHIQQLQAQHG